MAGKTTEIDKENLAPLNFEEEPKYLDYPSDNQVEIVNDPDGYLA